jgi:hypothetical protein
MRSLLLVLVACLHAHAAPGLNCVPETERRYLLRGASNECALKLKIGETEKAFALHKDFGPFPAGDAGELGDAEVEQPLQQVGFAVGMREPHHASARLVEAGDAVEHRGLAGAVRPDQRRDVGPADVERHVVDRDRAAIGLSHIRNTDDGLLRHVVSGRLPRKAPKGSTVWLHQFHDVAPTRVCRTAGVCQPAASDLPTFAAVTAILTAVALAACVLPARRAMRVNPLAALRCD